MRLGFLVTIIAFMVLGVWITNNIRRDALIESEADYEDLEVATFAGGCFWCIEAVFEAREGVVEAISGYSGGEVEDPTYGQVSSGQTGHLEAVQVYYDSEEVSARAQNDENSGTGVSCVIDSVREMFYEADRLLAERAILEAEEAGGEQGDIEKAWELYQEAVNTYAAGIYTDTSPKLSDVLDLFEEAWEKAVSSH